MNHRRCRTNGMTDEYPFSFAVAAIEQTACYSVRTPGILYFIGREPRIVHLNVESGVRLSGNERFHINFMHRVCLSEDKK